MQYPHISWNIIIYDAQIVNFHIPNTVLIFEYWFNTKYHYQNKQTYTNLHVYIKAVKKE